MSGEGSDAPLPTLDLVAGKYRLLRMLGRGGMGSVWEGVHESLGTRVAVKFIDREYAGNDEARKRFDNEARAAARLESRHVVRVFDHGVTDDGNPYIVMELLQGEPLDARLARVGRLSIGETSRILGQVCRALARAHEAGIVHRDLKPENIFLTRSADDDEETAKVLDFGIAKFAPQVAGVSSSTRTGSVLGTPHYMSPEQARGLRSVDHRTDLWSLGVIGYRCVVGALPFDGEAMGDLLVNICTAPLPVPSQRLAGLPPELDAWFARAVERDPALRYGSAADLAAGLQAAAAAVGEGPSSRAPSSASFEIGPPGGSATLAGAHALTAPRVPAMTDAAYELSRAGRGSGARRAIVLGAGAVVLALGAAAGVKLMGGRAAGSEPGGALVPTASATAVTSTPSIESAVPAATMSSAPVAPSVQPDAGWQPDAGGEERPSATGKRPAAAGGKKQSGGAVKGIEEKAKSPPPKRKAAPDLGY